MALFNGGAKGVVLTAPCRIINRCGIQQHPVILMTIGVDFAVDDGVQGNGTCRKRLQPCDRRDFGTNQSGRGRWSLRLSLGFTPEQGLLSGLLALSNALGSMHRKRSGMGWWRHPGLEI